MAPMFIQVDHHVFDITKITHIAPVASVARGKSKAASTQYEIHFAGGTSTVIPEQQADQLLNEIAALGRGNVLICRKAV